MSSGNEALKAGSSDEAVEDYRAAVSMKPTNPDALDALAGALLQQSNSSDAAEIFERLVALHPLAPPRGGDSFSPKRRLAIIRVLSPPAIACPAQSARS